MQSQVLVLASNEGDNALCIADTLSGTQLFNFKQNSSSKNGIAVIPGTDLIAAAQHNKLSLQFWRWSKDLPGLKCHLPEKMVAVKVSMCGSIFFAGSITGKLYAWDVNSGHLMNVWNGHYKAITCLEITKDGSHLISSGNDAIINVWKIVDILDRPQNTTLQGTRDSNIMPTITWTNHSLPVTSIHCGMGGLSGRIVSSSLDRTCKLWDIPSGELLYSISAPSSVNCCIMDPMENHLYMGCSDGKIYIVDLVAAASNATCPTSAQISSYVPQNMEQNTPGSLGQRESLLPNALEGHSKGISALCVSSCGKMVVSGDEDGNVRVWDKDSHRCIRTIDFMTSCITSLFLVPRPTQLYHSTSSNQQTPFIPFRKYMEKV